MSKFIPTEEYGKSGLFQFSGYIYEEFIKDLQLGRGVQVFKEMRDNDPTVGAMLFCIYMTASQVDWRVEPGGTEVDDIKAKEFIESCMHDMEIGWKKFIREILMGMVPFGFDYRECVYKLRQGEKGKSKSKYNDGMIGWNKIAGRSADSIVGPGKWEYDSDGKLLGCIQVAPPDYRRRFLPIEKCLLFRAPNDGKENPEGRALDPATIIPTPDGWKNLGEMNIGDKIFDEKGKIRYIVAKQNWENRPRYKIIFSDKTEIIADENHLWLVQNQYERNHNKEGKIRTTLDIYNNQKVHTKQKGGIANYSIQRSGCLDYTKQNLLIHPYFLGYWLGNGTSLNSSISCHANDLKEIIKNIEDIGYTVHVKPNGTSVNGRTIYVQGKEKWSKIGPQSLLRSMNLIENKHIPSQYLMGDIEQRLELLQGLMDSDGTIDDLGRCSFANTNINLINGVYELVRSLGIIASIRLSKKSNGKDRKHDAWVVNFTPIDISPFKLQRKSKKLKNNRSRNLFYITKVEKIENGKTVCIETDSESHLFLVSKSMIPTHNSLLRNAYRPFYFIKNIEVIEAIGVERDLAGLPVMSLPAEWLMSTADQTHKDLVEKYKRILRNIRRDEEEGLMLPSHYDENGHQLIDFKLLSSSGSRQFDTSTVIARKKQEIAATMLADFILLGHEKVGSFALTDSKTEMFALAICALLDEIEEVFNNVELPRLFNYNAGKFKVTDLPKLRHGDLETVDLQKLGQYINSLTASGMPLFPDPQLEAWLRKQGGMPEVQEEKINDDLKPDYSDLNDESMLTEEGEVDTGRDSLLTDFTVDTKENPPLTADMGVIQKAIKILKRYANRSK